jgi:hypothetical protein
VIYLFGTRARGDHRPDSDFDLLIVTKDADGEAGFNYDRAYAPICGLGVGCDVVPCPAHEFRARQEGLCGAVKRSGVKLYERVVPR